MPKRSNEETSLFSIFAIIDVLSLQIFSSKKKKKLYSDAIADVIALLLCFTNGKHNFQKSPLTFLYLQLNPSNALR
jgi:hypothetical protein